MPELPEVQTTVNALQIISNAKITEIKIFTNKLRYPIPKKIEKSAKNKKITNIFRIAKYIIINIEGDTSIIFHLGMSGRLKFFNNKKYVKEKHDHVVIYLNRNKVLIFNDQRKFGFCDLSSTSKLKKKKYLKILGPDPFCKSFNKNYLLEKFSRSNIEIKKMLLNQNIISGIGNIYANEILFYSKINPI